MAINIAQLQAQLAIMEKSADAEKRRANAAETTVEKNEANLVLQKEELKIQEKMLEITEAQLEVDKKSNDISEEEYKKQIKINEQKKENNKISSKALEIQEETNKKIKDSLDSIKDATKSAISSFTGVSDAWKDTFIGKLLSTEKGGASIGEKFAKIGQGLKETVTASNILGSSMMKLQESFIISTTAAIWYLDETASGFNKATGAGGKYNDMIADIGLENANLGITFSDGAEAIEGLKHGFMDFTSLSSGGQKELAVFAATMAEFGVSASDTGKNLQTLTRISGMSIEGAKDAQKTIASVAKQLGQSVGEMVAEFAQASPRLAAHGDKMADVFIDLQRTAKETGLSIDTLLNITEKFDTFEGAADAVGKLNNILGGTYLDSLELMRETDPTKRILMLKSALDDAGKSWGSMDYYQRKALASSMDISDQELGSIMKMTTKQIDEQALKQKEMAAMAQASNNALELLRGTMVQFVVALKPLLDGIRWVATHLADWSKNSPNAAKWVAGITVAVVLAAKAFSTFGFTAKWAGKAAGKGMAEAGAGAAVGAPGMVSFGGGMALVGLGILGVGAGIWLLVKAFGGLFSILKENMSEIKTLTSMAGSMALVGLAGIAAGVGLSAFAIGLGALGVALALIPTRDLLGLSDLMENTGKLVGEISDISPKSIELTKTLVDQADRYNTTQQEAKNLQTAPFTELVKAVSGLGGGQQKSKQPIQINLQLGERVLKRFVIDIMNDQANPRKA